MKKNLLIAKNSGLFLLVLLAGLPGCGGSKTASQPKAKKSTVMTEINIPVAGESIKSFFDEDIEEFKLIDDTTKTAQSNAGAAIDANNDDFSWVADLDGESNSFKTVYFDFNHYGVRPDQKPAVEFDIEVAKKMLAAGEKPTIVIEGNACHSAGSRTYNLALSEKRAKLLADKFVNAGIPRENIKIVPRGSEVPAHDKNGQPVTGSREQQWPNRRDEVHVIYS